MHKTYLWCFLCLILASCSFSSKEKIRLGYHPKDYKNEVSWKEVGSITDSDKDRVDIYINQNQSTLMIISKVLEDKKMLVALRSYDHKLNKFITLATAYARKGKVTFTPSELNLNSRIPTQIAFLLTEKKERWMGRHRKKIKIVSKGVLYHPLPEKIQKIFE